MGQIYSCIFAIHINSETVVTAVDSDRRRKIQQSERRRFIFCLRRQLRDFYAISA